MVTKKSSKRRTKSPPAARKRARSVRAPAQPVARAPARRSRGRAEGASIESLTDRLAELDRCIDVLKQTVGRLEAMADADVDALPLADQQAHARTLTKAKLAIEKLRNAKLATLNDAFESRRPELAQATSDLAHDLAQLQDVVAFIGAAAAAVGIVADVVGVIK